MSDNKRVWNIVLDVEGESIAWEFESGVVEERILKAATDAYRRRFGGEARAVIAHLKGDDAWLTEEVE